jgi:hypothetical protein
MTTVVVLQPSYLPWLGFFDQMMRSDVFVFYDDVQFNKNGWRNRNRIKSSTEVQWITVPVIHKNIRRPLINEIRIDNSQKWGHKHITSIKQNYSKSPFLSLYLPELDDVLSKRWSFLVDLDLALIELICNWLSITPNIKLSSELKIYGDKSERLLKICKYFDANVYLSGNAAESYLDENLFSKNEIMVEWHDYKHPVYQQLYGGFTPYLSIIDLIFNNGSKSAEIIHNKEFLRSN